MNPAVPLSAGPSPRSPGGKDSRELLARTSTRVAICNFVNAAQFMLDGKGLGDPALVLMDREYSYGDLLSASAHICMYLIQEAPTKQLTSVRNSAFM